MQKYLVISYDDDEQQWFYDVLFAKSPEEAQERIGKLRDYCICFDVISAEELTAMTRRIEDETLEQSEAWITELESFGNRGIK